MQSKNSNQTSTKQDGHFSNSERLELPETQNDRVV